MTITDDTKRQSQWGTIIQETNVQKEKTQFRLMNSEETQSEQQQKNNNYTGKCIKTRRPKRLKKERKEINETMRQSEQM